MWHRAGKRPQLSTAAAGRQMLWCLLLTSCPGVRGKPATDIISTIFSRREEHWGQNRGIGHSPWVLFLVLALNMLHILSHLGSVQACGSADRHWNPPEDVLSNLKSAFQSDCHPASSIDVCSHILVNKVDGLANIMLLYCFPSIFLPKFSFAVQSFKRWRGCFRSHACNKAE